MKENILPSGIDISRIENYSEVQYNLKDIMCVVCLNVVYNPIECCFCESLACEMCVEIVKISGSKCIAKDCVGSFRKPNKYIRSNLSKLIIPCEKCEVRMNYKEYCNHIQNANNCNNEFSCVKKKDSFIKLNKQHDEKIENLSKELEKVKSELRIMFKFSNEKLNKLDYEELRNTLVSFNLSINKKKEMYMAIIDGKAQEFEKLIMEKHYPILEEISTHNYFWTSLHYAMHYGQYEIINFIMNYLQNENLLHHALRLKSNDNRCPIMCLLKSNTIGHFTKCDLLEKIINKFPNYIQITPEIKKELKIREMKDMMKKYKNLLKM